MFVIADGNAIIVKPSSFAVAFDCLMKCHYVFNVKFANEVAVFYNFMLHVFLNFDQSNKLTVKALKLANEIKKTM